MARHSGFGIPPLIALAIMAWRDERAGPVEAVALPGMLLWTFLSAVSCAGLRIEPC
jgi:hypothetical protein